MMYRVWIDIMEPTTRMYTVEAEDRASASAAALALAEEEFDDADYDMDVVKIREAPELGAK